MGTFWHFNGRARVGKVSSTMNSTLIPFMLIALVLETIKTVPVSDSGEHFTSNIVESAMSRRAGGRLRTDPLKGQGESPDMTVNLQKVKQNEDDYDYESSSLLPCPGGNRWRNKITGECIRYHFGDRLGFSHSPWVYIY